MKRRTGLVSNSSSSSFTCLVKKEAFDKAYKEATPYTKSVIDVVSSETEIFGIRAVRLDTFCTPGGSMWEWTDIDFDTSIMEEDDDEIYAGRAFDQFLKTIPDEDAHSIAQDW